MEKHFKKSNTYHPSQGKFSNGEYVSDKHKVYAELCAHCNETLSKHIPNQEGLHLVLSGCFCPDKPETNN